jgi:hypothetical protein
MDHKRYEVLLELFHRPTESIEYPEYAQTISMEIGDHF